MSNKINKFLYDIKLSIEKIENYVQNKDIDAYSNDGMLKDAVERNFLIIGEAMNHIIKINPNIKITSTIEIIGMRNRIVHGYDMVSNVAVWDAIQNHIPILKQEINKLLEKI
jgi:uncharacterized protein with HEPN domain